MKRLLALLVGVALAASACSGGSNAVDQNATTTFRFTSGTPLGKVYPKAQRKPAENFTAQGLDGGTFQLSSTRGKVVVLNYWASWCQPCKTESPQFDALYRQIKSKGVDFVGIDTKDDRGNAQAFIQSSNISYPILFDEEGRTALQLGNLPTANLPFTVLIDQSGKVAGVYVVRMSDKDLETAIDTLLAGH